MFEKRFLGICGSLRKNSRNMGMLRYAAEHMPLGTMLTIADITEIPLYCEGKLDVLFLSRQEKNEKKQT